MRIVSLLPSATEILFAIGAGPEVVGVTHECDYPPEAKLLPHLTSSALPEGLGTSGIDRHVRASVHAGSSLYHLDSEALGRLAPDLIVTQELCAVCAVSYEIVDRAARRLTHDTRIVSLEPSSLDDVLANIEFLGRLAGCERGARDLVLDLQRRIDALNARRSPDERPRILVLEWTDPPMSAGHWSPGLVELAGGQCVLGNPGANSQTLTWDAIAAENPDAIVVGPCGYDLARTRAAIEELSSNPHWATLRAVRSGHVFEIDGNQYLNRPGPRLVDTAEIIAEALRATTLP